MSIEMLIGVVVAILAVLTIIAFGVLHGRTLGRLETKISAIEDREHQVWALLQQLLRELIGGKRER